MMLDTVYDEIEWFVQQDFEEYPELAKVRFPEETKLDLDAYKARLVERVEQIEKVITEHLEILEEQKQTGEEQELADLPFRTSEDNWKKEFRA